MEVVGSKGQQRQFEPLTSGRSASICRPAEKNPYSSSKDSVSASGYQMSTFKA